MTRCNLTTLFFALTAAALSGGQTVAQTATGSAPDLSSPAASTAWGFWKPDGLFYSGRVTKANGDLKYFVFDDGDAAWLPAEEIAHFDLKPGDHVHGNWQGEGRYYPATVLSVSGGRYRLRYEDDGAIEVTSLRNLRVQLTVGRMLTPGRRVFARWAPDGKYYPGTIQEQRDAQYHIRYDDGVTEWLEFGDLALLTVYSGMTLEARWLGRKLYYVAEVLSVNGEKVRVLYEDGAIEDTTVSMLRQTLTKGGR